MDLTPANFETVNPTNNGNEEKTNELESWFRLVKSPNKTPATIAFLRDSTENQELKKGDTLEVCPEACAVVQDVSLRLQRAGGAALFIDYGCGKDDGAPAQTVRSISRHGFCSFLKQPGQIDVTVCEKFMYERCFSMLLCLRKFTFCGYLTISC